MQSKNKRRGGSLSGGKEFGPPPERGPNPQGLKGGGCPHREVGAKSDIKGISSIQKSEDGTKSIVPTNTSTKNGFKFSVRVAFGWSMNTSSV